VPYGRPGRKRGAAEWASLATMFLRAETQQDAAHVDRLVREALGPGEATLVDQLHRDGCAVYSIVADVDGEIVSHAMFSRMRAPERTLGLGPVATAAGSRRQGLAGAVIREGLARARADGWRGVFVLGEPDGYRRFGFDPAAAAGVACRYAGPHLMFLALAGAPPLSPGTPVDYAAAFDALD